MILVIDNYDSFTYNLVDYIGKSTEHPIEVFRHDAITCAEIKAKNPFALVISPGPKTPSEAGISKSVIQTFGQTTPILGVCLGHQAIGEVFGGTIIRAGKLMHGKTSQMTHTNHPLFKNVPNPFTATRYHSLVIEPKTAPDCLEVIARSNDDNEIMAVAHKQFPIYGVQYHPESICTPDGLTMIRNFLNLATTFYFR